MPYVIDWCGDHSIVVFDGMVTYQELREIGPAHYGDARFDTEKYIIVDFSRANLSQITLENVTVLASIDSTAVVYNDKLKLAFVVNDTFQQGLCEKYGDDSRGFSSSWKHGIFLSAEEARRWCEHEDMPHA